MQHPVVAADGHTYEHDMLLEWFKRGHQTSPLTAAPLTHTTLIPNQSIRSLIIEFCEQHPEHKGSAEPFSGPGEAGAGAGASRTPTRSSDKNNGNGSSSTLTGTSASLASDFAAGNNKGADGRRAVVLAGVHQAEVHTRRLGVLPAYMVNYFRPRSNLCVHLAALNVLEDTDGYQ